MSHSNYCFLICIQVSQEAGKVLWYSHLFKNFSRFIVIHMVSLYAVNGADVFWNSLTYSMIHQMLAIWSLVSLPFLNPACTSQKFSVHLLLMPSLKDFEHNLTSMWMSTIVRQFDHSLALPFFEIEMKTDLLQSCGHWWIFQTCWRIYYSTLTLTVLPFSIL